MSTSGQERPVPRITQRDLEARSPASQGLITQFAVAGVMLSGLLTSSTAVPPAVPVQAQASSMRDSVLWSGNGLSVDDLRGLGPETASLTAVSEPAFRRLGGQSVTPATQVRRLWTISGLTGEQIARLFGVSRRAVHLWASGGRINAAHHERLAHLLAVISALPGNSPAQRRAALLAPDEGGISLFDRLRAENASDDDTDVSGTPWRPGDLLGGGQEPEET